MCWDYIVEAEQPNTQSDQARSASAEGSPLPPELFQHLKELLELAEARA